MSYYLGIDGGGSKTTCVVGDERSVLATSASGPSNITRVGEERARESMQQAIRECCATAKIEVAQISRTCVGIAGAGRKEVAEAIRKMVGEVISGEIEVAGDMTIALHAAFGEGAGVIVIAGTGSIAYGRNAQGKTFRAGGWGFEISDEGSAHWIGRTAVASVLRRIDEEKDQRNDAERIAETLPLFRELKTAWRLRGLDEFVRKANSHPDFAALLAAIIAAAESGDSVAQGVLASAGTELATVAGIVVRRMFMGQDAGSLEVWLSMAGGVFRHSSRVREYFGDEMRKRYPRMSLNPQVVEPMMGALQMARAGKR